MKINILKSTAMTCIGLIALGVGGTVWAAGCVDPDPKYPLASDLTVFVDPSDPDTYVAPDESIPAPSVTAFDGNLTCDSTTGLFGGFIASGSGTETFTSPDGSMQFTVTSVLDNGKAVWKVIHDETLPEGSEVTELQGIDATISASNKGSKGCNTVFGVDAGSGVSAYQKVNGGFVASDLFVCASQTIDSVPPPPPPPPVAVEECFLNDGDNITIYGVTVQCDGVPSGEQRTIFIAKDTETVDGQVVSVPGFGFTDDAGVIDFKNVCICNGPLPLEESEPECYADPLNPVPGLELCTVNDAIPALNVEIQNPRCVTYGGSRRCY
jgi:hypothetical protein